MNIHKQVPALDYHRSVRNAHTQRFTFFRYLLGICLALPCLFLFLGLIPLDSDSKLNNSSIAGISSAPASGDLAVIGMNSDASPDQLAIVALADISSGQTIYISDYGWDGSAFSTTGNTSEGAITWNTTSTVPAGTILNITINSGGVGGDLSTYGTVSHAGWSSASSAVTSGGDNWFIYQGVSATSPSSWIFGWANWSASTRGTLTWQTSDAPSATTSYLPGALSDEISLANTVGNGGLHYDNSRYTGTTSGDKATILSAITNHANWTGSETVTQDLSAGGGNFPAQFTIGALPVEMAYFKADAKEDQVILEWATHSESNNKGFYIQRKTGTHWEKVSFVAGHGHSNRSQTYQFVDQPPRAKSRYTYRLQQVDFDGNTSFSDQVEVYLDASPMTLYPSPNDGNFTLDLGTKYQQVQLRFLTLDGKLINQQRHRHVQQIGIESHLEPGFYLLEIQADSSQAQTMKLVIEE